MHNLKINVKKSVGSGWHSFKTNNLHITHDGNKRLPMFSVKAINIVNNSNNNNNNELAFVIYQAPDTCSMY